jgi:hypothetical protein
MDYRKGPVMYARAVCLLIAQPRTTAELTAALGVSASTAAKFVRVMHQRGLIHIERWRPPAYRGDHAAVYAFGPGEDAPALGRSCKRPQPLARPYADTIAFAELARAIIEAPRTTHEMVEQSGLTLGTVGRVVAVLRAEEQRALRIVEWDRSRKAPMPAYGFGIGPDAARPPPMTARQLNRRYRERRKVRDMFRPLHIAIAGNDPSFTHQRGIAA